MWVSSISCPVLFFWVSGHAEYDFSVNKSFCVGLYLNNMAYKHNYHIRCSTEEATFYSNTEWLRVFSKVILIPPLI